MFSSIVALLTDIIPLAAPARVAAPSTLDQGARTLTEKAPAEMTDTQDRREYFIGRWECTGTKTVQIQVLPYNGTMRNSWAVDNTWLMVNFEEDHSGSGESFVEDQYWGFSPESGVQTRPMMTSVNGFALVTSKGWEGNVSTWTGTYTVAGTVLDLTETVTILSDSQCRMVGEMFFNGAFVGGYDVMCTRKGKPYLKGIPTV